MRKLSVSLIVCSLLVMGFAKAQTVDQIINRYVDTLGGKAKLSALQTAILYGNLDYQGTLFPATVYRQQGKGYKSVVEAEGTSNYSLITDKGTWTFIPAQGQAQPEALSPEEAKMSIPMLDLQGALVNYKEKGNKVEYAGIDSVNGKPAYKIKVTTREGNVIQYLIDAKEYKLLKTKTAVSMNGQSVDVERTFGDYRRVDGILFPFLFETPYGFVTLDKIEVNKPIDEKVFTNG